jgi:hypothetical protein
VNPQNLQKIKGRKRIGKITHRNGLYAVVVTYSAASPLPSHKIKNQVQTLRTNEDGARN